MEKSLYNHITVGKKKTGQWRDRKALSSSQRIAKGTACFVPERVPGQVSHGRHGDEVSYAFPGLNRSNVGYTAPPFL